MCKSFLEDLLLYTRFLFVLVFLLCALLHFLSSVLGWYFSRTIIKKITFISFYFYLYFFLINNIEINAETSSAEEDEVALGVAQLAAFQVVLIFTAVAAILALTCRLRVFSSHEPARLKVPLLYYLIHHIHINLVTRHTDRKKEREIYTSSSLYIIYLMTLIFFFFLSFFWTSVDGNIPSWRCGPDWTVIRILTGRR